MTDFMLPLIVNNGKFGPGTYLSSSANNDFDIGYHFASKITFMAVLINRGSSIEVLDIVLKKQLDGATELMVALFKDFFINELLMYEKVLPLIKADVLNIYPKMYYGFVSPDKDYSNDILVLQDVRQQGFTVEQKLYLTFDQIVLALKKLGQFHSFSYLAKREHGEHFFSVVKTLRQRAISLENRNQLNYFAINRALKNLISEGVEVDLLKEVLNKLVDMKAATSLLIKPEEPYSVVCHGDFCLNNLLYKYNSEGAPIDLMFVDFQTSVYSTPAVDLSLFLYMNVETDTREQHWDDLLKIYWKSFSENIQDLEFNFQQFLDHFAKRAIYGLCISAFFLLGMLQENCDILMEAMLVTDEERIEIAMSLGGEKGTEALARISKHILKNKYFHKFLEQY